MFILQTAKDRNFIEEYETYADALEDMAYIMEMDAENGEWIEYVIEEI